MERKSLRDMNLKMQRIEELENIISWIESGCDISLTRMSGGEAFNIRIGRHLDYDTFDLIVSTINTEVRNKLDIALKEFESL